MSFTLRPHDLLWLCSNNALPAVKEAWVKHYWHKDLPVVVRRDMNKSGRVPVGIRGERREQRIASWVEASDIIRVVTPEMLTEPAYLLDSPLAGHHPVQALVTLKESDWPWSWGVTGSTGYALATGILVLHAKSDLDVVIRAPQQLSRDLLQQWQVQTETLPCRVDTQVETPSGAFSLNEWLRESRVLLKTATGPILTTSPWSKEPQ